MRVHPFLAVPLLFLLGAPLAAAQSSVPGDIAWDLPASAGGSEAKSFQCEVNTGADELILTILPDADLAGVTTLEAQLYFRAPQYGHPGPYPPLVSYWQMQPGGCRAGAFTVSTDFSGEPFAALPGFEDVVSGTSALVSYEWPYSGDPIRAAMTIAMPLSAPVTLLAGHRYYLCRVVLPHLGSVGTGACEGCCNEIEFGVAAAVSQSSGGWVWQPDGYAQATAVRGPTSLYACLTTPAPTRTWGGLKTRYR